MSHKAAMLAAGLLTAALLSTSARAQVDTDFSAGGGVKIGESTTTCDNTIEGAIRYNGTDKCMEFCPGNAWTALNACACINGLVGHWKFDDGSGTTATDDGSLGNDGTLNGPAWVSGKLGSHALDFDDTDDYVEVTHDYTSTDVTFMAWVKADSDAMTGFIVNKFENTSNGWGIKIIPSPLRVSIYEDINAGDLSLYQAPINDGEWVHIAAVIDGGEQLLYVNGALEGSGTDIVPAGENLSNITGNLYIGARGSSSEYFGGLIDDVRVYSRALDATEIATLYNNGAGCI